MIFTTMENLSCQNRIKYLIPRSAYILKSSDFLFHGINPFFSFLFIWFRTKSRYLVFQIMVFHLYEIQAVLIISVLIILAFQHHVHYWKFFLGNILTDPALISMQDCNSSKIDQCSDRKNICTFSARKWCIFI